MAKITRMGEENGKAIYWVFSSARADAALLATIIFTGSVWQVMPDTGRALDQRDAYVFGTLAEAKEAAKKL